MNFGFIYDCGDILVLFLLQLVRIVVAGFITIFLSKHANGKLVHLKFINKEKVTINNYTSDIGHNYYNRTEVNMTIFFTILCVKTEKNIASKLNGQEKLTSIREYEDSKNDKIEMKHITKAHRDK